MEDFVNDAGQLVRTVKDDDGLAGGVPVKRMVRGYNDQFEVVNLGEVVLAERRGEGLKAHIYLEVDFFDDRQKSLVNLGYKLALMDDTGVVYWVGPMHPRNPETMQPLNPEPEGVE